MALSRSMVFDNLSLNLKIYHVYALFHNFDQHLKFSVDSTTYSTILFGNYRDNCTALTKKTKPTNMLFSLMLFVCLCV